MRDEPMQRPEGSDAPELEALATALRAEGRTGGGGIEAALSAFREARDDGPLRRTGLWRRRRDDWRSVRGVHRLRLSLRSALGVLATSLALGGVALAVGAGVLPQPFDRSEEPPPRRTPAGTVTENPAKPAPVPAPRVTPTASPSGSPSHGEAGLCRALTQGQRARQGTAYERLVTAAGGPASVDGYCARVLASSSGNGNAGNGKAKGKKNEPPKNENAKKPRKDPAEVKQNQGGQHADRSSP